MTVHLPKEVESSIEAAVQSGRFASVDDAMREAARLLLRELDQERHHSVTRSAPDQNVGDPLLGLMRDDADLMDEIVTEAYRRRREEPLVTVNTAHFQHVQQLGLGSHSRIGAADAPGAASPRRGTLGPKAADHRCGQPTSVEANGPASVEFFPTILVDPHPIPDLGQAITGNLADNQCFVDF